jgi:3-methyladenine DNA glycosylase Tag
MPISNREKVIAMIANAIAVYSIAIERGSLPKNQSLIDFILKAVPKDMKTEISIDLIDEIFEYISNSHLELS